MKQCKLCNKDIPNTTVINNQIKKLSGRNYCLECVPWGSRKRFKGSRGNKPGCYNECLTCHKSKSYKGNYCRTCVSKKRRIDTKLKAIKLLGGSCIKCGWKKHPAGLEFHHPHNDKEFAIGEAMNRKWETVKKEVLKCELLCSCCHRIHHCKYDLGASGEVA